MRKRYLILGNGIAGTAAAQAIREADPDGAIAMVTAQPEEAYLRPLLTKAALNGISRHSYQMTDADWARDLQIEITTGCEALSIHSVAHRVTTTRGSFDYDKCIYALGGEALIPPVPGADLQGVYAIRTMADVFALKRRAVLAERAVVIGGGVIGMEAAEVLSHYGLSVTVLEAQEYLMPRVLDRETAELYASRLTGCRVETGVAVEALEGDGSVRAVRLADGRAFPCEIVVFCCGIRPNTEMARTAGAAVERGGVVVDACMRTNAADLFACGDCAVFEGENAALWRRAEEQGRVAGAVAAGETARYENTLYPIVFTGREVSLFALGDLVGAGGVGCEVRTRTLEPVRYFQVMRYPGTTYERRVFQNGRLVGAALVGGLHGMEALRREILGEGE